MNEPTHTGIAKDLYVLLNNWDEELCPKSLSFLTEIAGREIKLISNVRGVYKVAGYSELLINDNDLTDLKPIKKVIEIPEGDFWVEVIGSGVRKIIKVDGFCTKENHRMKHYTDNKVRELLSGGIWTICEEPKTIMRDWGYEDFDKIWSNGITVKYQEVLLLATRLNLHGLVIDGDFIEFEELCRDYTDRNGNKFEKEK